MLRQFIDSISIKPVEEDHNPSKKSSKKKNDKDCEEQIKKKVGNVFVLKCNHYFWQIFSALCGVHRVRSCSSLEHFSNWFSRRHNKQASDDWTR